MDDTERARSTRPWLRWVALGAVLVIGGVVGGIIGASTSGSGVASGSSSATSCPVSTVADKVVPSVVTISVSGPGGSGTGSGEVIRSNGYILTNNHVIATAAGAGSVTVEFADGHTEPATISGRDVQTDLAVLKVPSSSGLTVISLGSSGSVRVGDPVVAVGSPLGLSGTVTSGIVSALDRTVQVPGEDNRSALLVAALQTDAAINPGNSGGALVNCAGDLVAVPTAGASVPGPAGQSSAGSIGLGFAIPVDLASSIADEIIATGRVTHAFFGVQTRPITSTVAIQAGVPEGLFVEGVTAGGPAAQAGLRPGDVITSVAGAPAVSNIQLQELTLTKRPGTEVPVEYWRDGRSTPATIVLVAQP